MVFQGLALFPHLTVSENIGFGLRMRKVRKDVIGKGGEEALDLVALPHQRYGQRRITQISGGERQRVALARALVTEPQVLLLDEPFGALDLKLRKQMQEETKKLQRTLGITFVFVTHDQEEALTMSNIIGVINRGRIEQIGNSHEIYERPATKFVAGFIGEANIIRATVAELRPNNALMKHDRLSIVPPARALRAGEEVFLSIRPEKVRVGSSADRCANRFEGTIADEVYVGLSSKVTIQLDLGGRLISRVPIVDIGQSIPIGSHVMGGWGPENGVIN